MSNYERGRRREKNWLATVSTLFVLLAFQRDAAAFSFDDITYWVGSGSNRAALAIDWQQGTTQPASLVWGYRWNGSATGAQMLQAIVADDPRLFAKLGGTAANPIAVYGLGYDANKNGEFGIDDGTAFDSLGFAFTGPADLATATDAGDYYAEGWFIGLWHYGTATSDPYTGGQWVSSQTGMASRQLADGAWDSWAFTSPINFTTFAVNPVAAAAPWLPGDFDHDGQVTPSDYAVWRASYGSTTQLAADANGNGVVDAADYIVWRSHAGAQSAALATQPLGVPEPGTALLVVMTLCFVFLTRWKEC